MPSFADSALARTNASIAFATGSVTLSSGLRGRPVADTSSAVSWTAAGHLQLQAYQPGRECQVCSNTVDAHLRQATRTRLLLLGVTTPVL